MRSYEKWRAHVLGSELDGDDDDEGDDDDDDVGDDIGCAGAILGLLAIGEAVVCLCLSIRRRALASLDPPPLAALPHCNYVCLNRPSCVFLALVRRNPHTHTHTHILILDISSHLLLYGLPDSQQISSFGSFPANTSPGKRAQLTTGLRPFGQSATLVLARLLRDSSQHQYATTGTCFYIFRPANIVKMRACVCASRKQDGPISRASQPASFA